MKSVVVGLVAVVMGTLPAVAAEGPGRALVASNTLQIANNPVQSATNSVTITRSFIPPYSGTVRVKWEYKSKDGTNVVSNAYVSNLNGCVAETTSTDYVTGSCDLPVTAGMPINIAAYANDGGNTAYLRSVSLSYKVVNSAGDSIELTEQ